MKYRVNTSNFDSFGRHRFVVALAVGAARAICRDDGEPKPPLTRGGARYRQFLPIYRAGGGRGACTADFESEDDFDELRDHDQRRNLDRGKPLRDAATTRLIVSGPANRRSTVRVAFLYIRVYQVIAIIRTSLARKCSIAISICPSHRQIRIYRYYALSATRSYGRVERRM